MLQYITCRITYLIHNNRAFHAKFNLHIRCRELTRQITSAIPFSWVQLVEKPLWRRRGLNSGPLTCEASALPLSYVPTVQFKEFIVLGSKTNTYFSNIEIHIHKVYSPYGILFHSTLAALPFQCHNEPYIHIKTQQNICRSLTLVFFRINEFYVHEYFL